MKVKKKLIKRLRKEKSALEKISYLENQAVKQIEDKLSRNAIELTERFLERILIKANHAEIINSSIQELETTLNKPISSFNNKTINNTIRCIST